MCGICGFVDCRADEDDDRAIAAMTATLYHRGPDGEGLVQLKGAQGGPMGWFGHRRLKIIDLTEAASQPMRSADGAVVLTYNGEIYNHRELRSELRAMGHRFQSTGDTEVVLRAYEQWGEGCLDRLDGMFAFAIWDGYEQRLLLARDRPGKKPLFYAVVGDRLLFGSEIKAILASGYLRPELDDRRLNEFLVYGYVPAPATLLREILQVPPASVLTWSPGQEVRVRRYWEPAYPEGPDSFRTVDASLLARIRSAFADSVSKRLIADVPVGAFLSGGVDSSLVVAAMVEQGEAEVNTFSIGFPEDGSFDERPFARAVAHQYGTRHTEFEVKADAVALLNRLLWHLDQPFADSSCIPTFLLSQLAAEHVTVILNGDGGDEVFGGYDRFRAAAISRLVGGWAGPPGRLLTRILPSGGGYFDLRRRAQRFFESVDKPIVERYLGWVSMIPPDRVDDFLLDAVRPVHAEPPETPFLHAYEERPGLPILDRLLYANFQTYLPDDLAVKMDRMSMAHSLETRSPFLDTSLVDLVAQVPSTRKVGLRTTKPLLRRAFAPLLPASIWQRPKHGFGVPMHSWFRGELGELYEDEVLGRDAHVTSYLDRDALSALYLAHRVGRSDEGFRLWTVLTLERWLRLLRAGPPTALAPGSPVLEG